MSAQTHNMEDKYKVRHVGLKTSPDSVKIDYLEPVSVLQISLGNPELNSVFSQVAEYLKCHRFSMNGFKLCMKRNFVKLGLNDKLCINAVL